MNLSHFFAELTRRNVYRAGVAYAAVAWLLIQVVTQVSPYFDIPSWVVRFIIILLVVGFPVAVVLAWAFELTPRGLKRSEDLQPSDALPQSTGRKINVAIIAVLLLAVAILVFDRARPRRDSDGADVKSVAVLPFENLSDDKENAFFADGMQDDILTSLANIGDLKVISRTSVMQFRGTEKRNLRDIGKTLGAVHILEGSVRRAADRVVVNVQLIDARNDHHVWAHRYNEKLADALGLQGELAREIAQALRASISPEEKARVETKPTANTDAYVIYLRARQYEFGPDTLLQDYKTAEQLYADAIKLDPNFALAHARLATTRAAIFHYYEPLDSWKAKVLAGAQEALRLQPNLAEAHFALGLYYYFTERDYERALNELSIAQRLAPSDANSASVIASIRRRQGQWREALELYQRARSLDPQNANVLRNLFYTLTAMREWRQASLAGEQLRRVAPDAVVASIQGAYVEFSWRGETTKLKETLAAIPAGVDPDGFATASRWDLCMIERDYAGAEQVLARSPLEGFSYLNTQETPKSYLGGCTALARGDAPLAEQKFALALPKFEAAVSESPLSAERHANLGLLYAFLGRKPEAIREAQRAVELMPESKDALDGAIMNCFLALTYARVGENDLALPLIERLLHTAGATESTFYSITIQDLRKRWVWDPLRADARFQQLIERAE